MFDKEAKKKKKLDKLLKIVNISDEELSKLTYKEKQRYFKAKTNLAKVFHGSRDKDGNGVTYIRWR